MNVFKGKRRVLWLSGMAVFVLGLLAVLVIGPLVSPTPGGGGPEVDVPKMQNAPADETPKMRLDLDEKR